MKLKFPLSPLHPGIQSFPEAITTVFPEANVQTCIVHLIRHSLSFCGWKERQKVAAELKMVYRAENAEAAAQRLSEFESGPWGKKFPMIAASWKRNWEQVIPFFAYSPEIRKMIYTTNAIESLHMQLRKVIKNRGHFPADADILKRLAEIDKTLLSHDKALLGLWRQIQPLLAPPPDPPRKEIGFHVKEKPASHRAGNMKHKKDETH